jgi:hypothetical protein
MSYVSPSDPIPAAPLIPPGLLRQAIALRDALTLDRLLAAGLCAASLGFFLVAYTISMHDPDYFNRRLLASMRPSDVDPIITGTVETATGASMPVPTVMRSTPLAAADYQIVMVFQDEAILATAQELWRVKVGSEVPGLGTVLAIDATDTGGTVKATEATLRSVVN